VNPDYPAPLRQFLDTLALVADPADRATLLIGYADRFSAVPPEVARRPYGLEHQVPFCESEAYVWAVPNADGTLKLHFAVENPSGISAKALAVILNKTLSGLPAAEIARISPDIVHQIFRQNISMGKGMGLMAMVQAVQTLARRALHQRDEASTPAVG
jgi:cysteine desulfuration protein SufE